ncbi:MAG: winged helix-turn-helix transcriptional regulator [Alphaproteobacteria bacterium]
MSNAERIPVGKADDAEITLGILNAIHENERITQRTVAQDLGIALGLTNAYLKRCVKKGLIKVSQAPANRYAYYLTPQGFSEKSRLTAEYLSDSFRFFRNARSQCTEALNEAARRGWKRIALYGASELAEVASLCEASDVEIVAIVDPGHSNSNFAHLPVVQNIAEAGDIDALLLTAVSNPQAAYDSLVRDYPASRVIVPGLLRISKPLVDEAAP